MTVCGGTVQDEKMATVRAVVYTENGGPDVLRVIERPVREPGPGEVRVRVHRAGVNPTDWKSRQGGGTGRRVDPPQVPGQDGAGVVEAVGNGVEAALQGLRVWVCEAAYERPDGTAQAYAVVPARRVVTLPDSASYDVGASLGVPFITAHRCLTVTEEGPRRLGPGTLDGRTVLVAGCAGAVGNAAIQLARWSDATIIATVSSPRRRAAGCVGRRRPCDQLPAAGRGHGDPQDRAEGCRHHRRGRSRGERRDRCRGPGPARLGHDTTVQGLIDDHVVTP
jgi:NADPH2:quinone reductase